MSAPKLNASLDEQVSGSLAVEEAAIPIMKDLAKSTREPQSASKRVDSLNGEGAGNANRLINAQEAADILSVPLSTIYYWSHKKLICGIKVGRHLRFDPEELIRYFKEGTNSVIKPSSHTAPKKPTGSVEDELRSLKIKFSRPAGRQ